MSRLIGGAAAGAAAIVGWSYFKRDDPAHAQWHALRRLLPDRIVLVRHGESEGNADHTLYRTKADNLIELTETGTKQAIEAGKRIKKLIGDESVDIYVSPFYRTMQTAEYARLSFPGQARRTHVDSRIREQEFGNLQGDEFKSFREEQKIVGRFFYRFPTGESGADVFDRTESWWESKIARHNVNPTREPSKTVIVFTHGLTMRLILMQLYSWSPNTFETVWNAGNCDIYVLRKDLSINRKYPYRLCPKDGDMPKSSIKLLVTMVSGETQKLVLEDYISIPPPRTEQLEVAKKMLQDQHGIEPAAIKSIDFYGGKFQRPCDCSTHPSLAALTQPLGGATTTGALQPIP